MSAILQNSIWPNAGGTLGENKVVIPDGVNVKWPEGDTFLGNCIYQNGKLVGFVDTKALTLNDSYETTFDYDYVNITLNNISEGDLTVNKGTHCKYLIIKWGKSVEGEEIALIRFEDMDEDTKTLLRSATSIRDNVLYDENNNVIGEFNTDSLLTSHTAMIDENGFPVTDETTNQPKPIDGKSLDALFTGGDLATNQLKDTKLVSFDSGLSNLTSGFMMFYYCPTLTSFTADLSSLTNSFGMFGLTPLTSFAVDLPSLTNGATMFFYCTNLKSFNSDLSSLIIGSNMFENCARLTTFTSNLSSLTNGYSMFNGCNLDTISVQNIADTIKNVTSLTNGSSETDEVYKEISIGIGNSEPNGQEINAFNTIASRGWTVLVNGSEYTPSSPAAIATLDENGEEIVTPIPYYAKPVETTEKCANYIGEDGKYYNIVGGQFIYGDDLSTYGMFTCEEDAALNMRLTKLEKSNKFNSL